MRLAELMSKKNLTLNSNHKAVERQQRLRGNAKSENIHTFFMFQFTPAAFFKNTKTMKTRICQHCGLEYQQTGTCQKFCEDCKKEMYAIKRTQVERNKDIVNSILAKLEAYKAMKTICINNGIEI